VVHPRLGLESRAVGIMADGWGSSGALDRCLTSENRERLAYAQAMGEQLLKQVA
jgi:hypothetical protein